MRQVVLTVLLQAWLGFYNSQRRVKWSKPELVQQANRYAQATLHTTRMHMHTCMYTYSAGAHCCCLADHRPARAACPREEDDRQDGAQGGAWAAIRYSQLLSCSAAGSTHKEECSRPGGMQGLSAVVSHVRHLEMQL